jgi:hypothetical protein
MILNINGSIYLTDCELLHFTEKKVSKSFTDETNERRDDKIEMKGDRF